MDVLSVNKLFVNSPAESVLGNDLYSSPANSQVDVAKRTRYTGRIKASSNSLSLNGVTTFNLDPGVIYNKLYIYGKFSQLPQYVQAQDGWGYALIKTVNFVCSGSSSIQNLKVDGRSMMDMIIATTNSSDKRNQLMKLGGRAFEHNNEADDQDFCIPIYMLFSSADSGNVTPFDSATIRSIISFSIEWNPLYTVMSGSITVGPVNHAVVLPTQFSELFLRAHNSIELERQFVAQKMAMFPQLVYSVPCNYYQSYKTYAQVTNITDEVQINLTSFPNGMLQAILLSVVPNEWFGDSTTLSWTCPAISMPLSYLRVLYNGQVMYETNSATENEAVSCIMDDGSSSIYQIDCQDSITQTGSRGITQSYINVIPFVNEVSNVLRGKLHENVKSYSGSNLQFFLKLDTNGLPIEYTEGTREYIPPPTGTYTLQFTYVVASLLEVQNGTMSLQFD